MRILFFIGRMRIFFFIAKVPNGGKPGGSGGKAGGKRGERRGDAGGTGGRRGGGDAGGRREGGTLGGEGDAGGGGREKRCTSLQRARNSDTLLLTLFEMGPSPCPCPQRRATCQMESRGTVRTTRRHMLEPVRSEAVYLTGRFAY
jgi:hypothetical protein